MILPLGTDRDGRRPAIAVPLLIAVNLVVYVAMRMGVASVWLDPASGIDPINAALKWAAFQPNDLHWWQWITALFTHDLHGYWHIVGNMLFLWAFGKPLESHIGFWRFMALYFLGGFAATLMQWLISGTGGIGASGAISTVAGLFIAFFPRSHTKIFYLFTLSVMYVPSAWLIGLYVAIDVVNLLLDLSGMHRSGVGNAAHLGGMLFGVLSGLLLLKLGLVPRGEWDLLYATKQFVRRQRLRSALRGPAVTPWSSGKAMGAVTRGGPLDASTAELARLRAVVHQRMREPDGAGATEAYRRLITQDPQATLTAELQLQIANRAMAEGASTLAAQAYTNFLAAYPNDAKASEVRLILAIVYVRRLHQHANAKPLLEGLPARLHDPEQRALAQALTLECSACA